eukprot:TRINITY_DN3274_c0_g1_i3.p1 TRINITY_DN3274_c0_g1~~TRINITY_DN3274_c0_g1_i3.p1  ORF type:complete len:475 (-),score=117.12 TRINITY_DN3274_c0_g1_i3:169-1509(-)
MENHVVVLVLGDVGRSPRMQYHSVSLTKLESTKVTLVGCTGERCHESVENNPLIEKQLINPFPWTIPLIFFLLMAPIKVLYQIVQLFWLLMFKIQKPKAILVQNPPSIPVLSIVWFVCLLRRCKFVIDWHNFGYTILDLKFVPNPNGKKHPLVVFAKWYEKFFGHLGDNHLCVTHAMKEWLAENFNVNATVLHDRPADCFKRATLEDSHQLLTKLRADFRIIEANIFGAVGNGEKTLLTEINPENGEVQYRKNRPALLISSTSWTPDEDMGILFDGLCDYDRRASVDAALPHVVVAITGKGPLKEQFEGAFAAQQWNKVHVVTLWLESEDYPRLLGAADLGVSLHKSSSNLDLPMKVVDMFGCDLPVLAVNFDCLDELVQHGINGLTFEDGTMLASRMRAVLKHFPENELYDNLRKGAEEALSTSWHENWIANAAPIFCTGNKRQE